VRIYPHDQDTGGFFICKLRKTADHMVPKKLDTTAEAAPAADVKMDAAPAPAAAANEEVKVTAEDAAVAPAGAPAAEGKAEVISGNVDAKMETEGGEAVVGEKRCGCVVFWFVLNDHMC